MRVLAIIPARAGSKGVPGKNIKVIGGKPLLAYSIEAAQESKYVSTIVVSSDGDDILEVAARYPEVIAHKRDERIAQDGSSVVDAVQAVIDQQGRDYDLIVLLQPSSPIRTGKHIDDAVHMLMADAEANSLISVIPTNDAHPARMYWKDEHHGIRSILKEFEQTRRQDIPTAYLRNGSIYAVKMNAFLETRSLMAKPSLGFEMSASLLLNIDEPRDILIAEVLIQAWKNKEIQ